MKPGYRTTEFAAAVAALVVAGLVAAGVLGPDEREGATHAFSEALMAGIALWGALRAVVAYIEGRTALKAASKTSDFLEKSDVSGEGTR